MVDISKDINRAINIITKPKKALEDLKGESMTKQDLIVYLGLIGVPTFLGVLIGYGFIGYGTSLVGWGFALAVIQYVLSIIGIIVFGYILNALAPSFKSKQNLMNAMKLVAASATPWLIAGIFYFYPAAGVISFLGGIYGLYILYLGIPILMETPKDQHIVYLVVGLIVYIIIMGVVSLITGAIWGSIVQNAIRSAWGGYYGYYPS